MTRQLSFGLRCALLALLAAPAHAQHAQVGGSTSRVTLFVDADDDDDDGIADSAASALGGSALLDIHWLRASELGSLRNVSPILSQNARFVVDNRPLPSGARLPAASAKLGLQGLRPGRTPVLINRRTFDVSVVGFDAYDAHGSRVDLASSHASISRVLPAFLSNDDAGASDLDALRWVAVAEEDALPSEVEVFSLDPAGKELDRLEHVELWELPCPPASTPGLACRGTPLIRATADRIDRAHPESAGRSLRAEVGGKLVVRVAGRKAASIRVGGPRVSALGAIERLRVRLNVHVLRTTVGGPPALGADDADALQRVRNEVQTASLLWGQCGVHFGPARELAIRVVDPPAPFLLSLGCGFALPASGGEIRLRAGRKAIRLRSSPGELPANLAQRLAALLSAQNFSVEVLSNPRNESSQLASLDLLVRENGAPVTLERDGESPLSSDPSLNVCIGKVDFADGVQHFTDHNAALGTTEERTLIHAYADRDPSTVEVFVVPAFSGSGRVGESFVDAPGAAIHNTVLLDRAAVLAGARSHVLAHEIGHILLNMPGHPDDSGVDQPSALMDSDATDPSIFGPRRLSLAECERAVRERGPSSRAPLLYEWPLITRAR